MQKPRVFEASQTKTSKLTLNINTNQRRKAWYLRHSPTKNNKKLFKKKSPKHHLVHENHTKIEVLKLLTKNPPKNKRHTPRGGRRNDYLVVVVGGVVVGVGVGARVRVRVVLVLLLM